MTTSPPLFVELCAGTAALSLRLQARHARPPVSRMGAKTGYADAILAVMGLRPGQRAGHYLWCDPDPGCRLLLEAYRDRELAQAAADIIRGWKDEEPRALWERLRAEGPVKEDGGAREVGRFVLDVAWSIGNDAGKGGFKSSNAYGEWFAPQTPDKLANRTDSLPTLPATIAPDARTVDPREVARWLYVEGNRHPVGDCWKVVPAGINSGANVSLTGLSRVLVGDRAKRDRWSCASVGGIANDATILPDASTVDPVPPLPPGTVAYIDPPYVGTTGYAADLPRSEVVRLARLWNEAGARVYISEAAPLAELDGWHRVEITATRKGQKRTFSKQQAEWLTCSHPPAWTPAVQGDLIQWAAK